MTEDEQIAADRFAGLGDLGHFPNAIVERLGRLGADRSLGGQPHVGHDDVGARLGQQPRLLGVKGVGRRQQVELVRGRDAVDLVREAHAGLFQVDAQACRRSGRRSGSSGCRRTPCP